MKKIDFENKILQYIDDELSNQDRIEFESYAGQMSLEQLSESLKANEKLIQLFELQKGAIPQVLEMMQTVLKQELEKKQSLN